MSKQTDYQKRMREQGRCVICGKPVCERSKYLCDKHRIQKNKHSKKYRDQRKQKGID